MIRTVDVCVTGWIQTVFYHSSLHHNHAYIWKGQNKFRMDTKHTQREKSQYLFRFIISFNFAFGHHDCAVSSQQSAKCDNCFGLNHISFFFCIRLLFASQSDHFRFAKTIWREQYSFFPPLIVPILKQLNNTSCCYSCISIFLNPKFALSFSTPHIS